MEIKINNLIKRYGSKTAVDIPSTKEKSWDWWETTEPERPPSSA